MARSRTARGSAARGVNGGAATRWPRNAAPPSGCLPCPSRGEAARGLVSCPVPVETSACAGERARDPVLRTLRLLQGHVAGEHGEGEPAALAGRAVAGERAHAARGQRAGLAAAGALRAARREPVLERARAARARERGGEGARRGPSGAGRRRARRPSRGRAGPGRSRRRARPSRPARFAAAWMAAAPPAVEPGTGASFFVSSSAIQSSDGRSMAAMSVRTGADCAPPMASTPAGAVPARGTPEIVTPRASRTSSKRAAAARAGSACTGPSGVGAPAPVRERGERAAELRVEHAVAGGAGAPRVEARLVPDDRAGDQRDARELVGERARAARRRAAGRRRRAGRGRPRSRRRAAAGRSARSSAGPPARAGAARRPR